MQFTAKNYYRAQFVIAVPFIQLTHAQRLILSEVYSNFTGQPPGDVYCDACMRELYARVRKEVENFVNQSQTKTL